MAEFSKSTVDRIVSQLPPSIRDMLMKHPSQTLAGGAVRDLVWSAPVSDYDIWGPAQGCPIAGSPVTMRGSVARWMLPSNETYGVTSMDWIEVQPSETRLSFLDSFDFQLCAVALWYEDNCWHSFVPNLLAEIEGLPARHVGITINSHDALEFPISWQRYMKLIQKGYFPMDITTAHLISLAFTNNNEIFSDEVESQLLISLAQNRTGPRAQIVTSFAPTGTNAIDSYRDTNIAPPVYHVEIQPSLIFPRTEDLVPGPVETLAQQRIDQISQVVNSSTLREMRYVLAEEHDDNSWA